MTTITPTARRTSPVLRAQSLDAGYGDVPVVHGVDLEVRSGEVVALLGRNGAGKTTTLMTLAGALPALGGQVLRKERPAGVGLPLRARGGLAFIPETRAVFTELTVRENLRLGQGTVAGAVDLFPELSSHLDRRAGDLSGGQQQMLTLARALAAGPDVLLADELSLGLAPIIVERVLSVLRQYADRGLGVLLVEQHVRQALAIADRGYVMDRGAIVVEGTTAELQLHLGQIEQAYLDGLAE